MASRIIVSLLLAAAIAATVDCNFEADALYAWKKQLLDPNNVLQSWNLTLQNPCTWFHITCNLENSVTRVDLGNAGLSGPLAPQLAQLANLQYLEIYSNSIKGTIPAEFGNLTKLVSLDLYDNQLTGSIPASLGNLQSLKFMRLNSNKISGTVPTGVINLVITGRLMILNVSDNFLSGTVHTHDPKGFAITTIIQDPKATPK